MWKLRVRIITGAGHGGLSHGWSDLQFWKKKNRKRFCSRLRSFCFRGYGLEKKIFCFRNSSKIPQGGDLVVEHWIGFKVKTDHWVNRFKDESLD